jgi:hypothetical protein
VLNALREIQVPLLAILLIGGCAAKARRAITARSVDAAISPTSMFPLHLRRPAAIALCATELGLGVALVITAGTIGAGTPAMVTRGATALLFLTAVGTLNELRSRRPDAGCGCFGDLSHTPVSWRTLARSALLSVAALAAITAPPLREPSSPGDAWLLLAMVAAELGVLAAVSPEVGELMIRLGYSEPCEVRRLPVSRTLTSLHGSSQWRRYRRQLITTEPTDVWREGCWRYAVFPGMADGRLVDIVFAVYLQARRPPVRAAIVDAVTDETVPSVTIPVQRGATAPYPMPVFIPAPPTDLYHSIKETQ